jgi:nitric oxide reductase subunit B
LFWIATAWLAAGLFIGPLVSNHEPKYQRLGVNILFGALLLVVVGSLTGEWLSIKNYMSDTVSFYLGHQGYEYVELGRIWQIALIGRTAVMASPHAASSLARAASEGRSHNDRS